MLWLLRPPASQVLNSSLLQAENLFCRQPVWKASVIKGFSFCAGQWQFHRVFSELKEGERKKSLLIDVVAEIQPPFQSAAMKSLLRNVLSITSAHFYTPWLFLEELICVLFISSAGMFCWHCTQWQIKALVSWQWHGWSQYLLWALRERQGSQLLIVHPCFTASILFQCIKTSIEF